MDENFAAPFDRFKDAQILLLGEATHGTSEFYRARAAITKRFIEKHGFSVLAIEGDWPDAAELDSYVRHHGRWGERSAFVNFPRWMWRNREFAALLSDLRAWNETKAFGGRVAVRGLDLYSLHRSAEEVLNYLDRVDEKAARIARRHYGCMSPYFETPEVYGAKAAREGLTCEDAVIKTLMSLLGERLRYAQIDEEAFFDAEQNARVVCSAERYYRAMSRGAAESWNLRDSHMFDTLVRLLQRGVEDIKMIVWAHNSHIGDASFTSMGESGEHNIGQLCRKRFGDRLVAIGFSTDRGQVLAADDWGAPPRVKDVLPARSGSWERALRDAGHERALWDWSSDPPLRQALLQRRLERAIGVIYRPETERWSHYFEAYLGGQFDAMVWFEATTPVEQLPGATGEGAPDTYPFGL